MIIHRLNPFLTILRNQADDAPSPGSAGAPSINLHGGPPADGLTARLDAAVKAGQVDDGTGPSNFQRETPLESENQKPREVKIAPKKDEPAPAQKKDQEPPAAKEEEEEEEIEEEEFPDIGAGSKADEGELEDEAPFDEKAFDAETDRVVAAIEAKGHPGEVYRELRGELKATRRQLSEAAAKTVIPKEIENELNELRPLKEEVEGLRQRTQELARANDEVAVRESKEYQENIIKPSQEIEETIQLMADAADLDPNDLYNAVMEPNPAKQDKLFDALKSKLGDRGISRLNRFADDYKSLQAKAREMMTKATETIARDRQAREKEAEQAAKARRGEFQTESRAAFEKYAAKVPGLTDSSGQLTEEAKALRAKTVAIDPDSISNQDLGFMAFTARAFPAMRKAIVQLQSENKSLRAGRPTNQKVAEGTSKTKTKAPEGVHEDGSPKGLQERMKEVGEFTFDPSLV